jgi:siderophore synthetase component
VLQTSPTKSKVIRFAVIGVVLTTLVATVSKCSGIDEKHLYDLIDEIQRKYFPNTELNEYIIKDPKLLDNRVKRDVDKAIAEYERLTGDDGRVRIPSPRYSENPIDNSVCYTDECKALGGEIRLCAPWVDNCPSDVVK